MSAVGDLLGTWFRAVLSCCSAVPERIKPAPPPKRPPSYMQIQIHTGGDIDDGLVKRQLQFRRAKRAQAEKQRKLLGAMLIVQEDDEDRSRWLRLAACMVLQMSVRVIARRESGPRTPTYLRSNWAAPGGEEMTRRLTNILERFPDASFEETKAMLLECRGHAGYVVDALQKRQKDAK